MPTQSIATLKTNMARVVRGKDEVIELALVCLFAEGHLLIEDVPGVGKTTIARGLAASTGVKWHRIQFTPDLLPSDVTGVSIYNQSNGTFEFKPGSIFANIVLADEINRASPKTQSALLEVMEEQQVTVDAVAYPVPRPFMVVATQNPIDMDGTYALPEAQLDRFLMRVRVGYPDHEAEVEILDNVVEGRRVESLQPVMRTSDVGEATEGVRSVYVAPPIRAYIVELCAATRTMPDIRLGASPRGSVALLRACRASAYLQGRDFVTPDDVQLLAEPVLAHRVLVTPEAELQGRTSRDAVQQAVRSVAVPQLRSGV